MILFYSNHNEYGSELQSAVALEAPENETLEVFHTLKELLDFLRHPFLCHTVLLFYADSFEDLDILEKHRSLVETMKKIFVLPDNEESMVRKALALYPSYLTESASDMSDILSILEKLRNQYQIL